MVKQPHASTNIKPSITDALALPEEAAPPVVSGMSFTDAERRALSTSGLIITRRSRPGIQLAASDFSATDWMIVVPVPPDEVTP